MLKETIKEIMKIFHSDHPFMLIITDIISWLSYIWNYQIFATADKHPIAVANVVTGVVLFILGLRVAKYCSIAVRLRLFKTTKVDMSVAKSLERISYYIFILLMSVFVLDVTNVPLTAFTVVGTTLALGVGLGSQNIANNFISGLLIMVERPIKLGDIIEIKALDVVGTVINIGARCVSIRAENNINVLIPNSNILQDTVINWTLDDTNLKTTLPIGLEFGEYNLEQIDSIFSQVLSSTEHILQDPKPQILLKNMNKDGMHYELEFWINLDSVGNRKYVFDQINRGIEPLLRTHNIKIGGEQK